VAGVRADGAGEWGGLRGALKRQVGRAGAEDGPQRALDIEVTVPRELLGAAECRLCAVPFTSADAARLHYLGRRHAQKENQYVRKIYEERGINVTRFLAKARPKPAPDLVSRARLSHRVPPRAPLQDDARRKR